MIGRIIVTALALVLAAPALAECQPPTALTADHSEYIKAYAVDSLDISFTPDATGTATTAVLGLQFCSRNDDVNSCQDLDIDTTGNGLGDTNLLDGSTVEQSGVTGMTGFRWLRVFASVNPLGGEEPEFTICTHK